MKGMSARHRWALGGGALAAVLASSPPLSAVSAHLVALHMVGQMLLLAGAGPLLTYAAAGTRWRRTLVAIHPLAGMVAFNGVVFTAQLPTAVAAAAHQPAFAVMEQLACLGAAIAFWAPILRPDSPGALRPIARIGYLLIAGCPPTIPGVVLAFSHRLYYTAATGSGAGAFGIQALDDQQLAGLILFGTTKLVLVTFTFGLLWRMLGGEPEEPPDDRRDDSVTPAAPPDGPAWLNRLDEELPEEARPIRSRARGTPTGNWAPDSVPAAPAAVPALPGPESPRA